jgi:hypothetical protein
MNKKNIEELKQKIYAHITNVHDEVALQLLEEASEAYASPDQKDILNELTPIQQTRLDEAVQQAEKGEVVSNEAVKEEARKWLSK